jgi:hypothetical protein
MSWAYYNVFKIEIRINNWGSDDNLRSTYSCIHPLGHGIVQRCSTMLMFCIIRSQVPHLSRGFVMGGSFLKTNDERIIKRNKDYGLWFFYVKSNIVRKWRFFISNNINLRLDINHNKLYLDNIFCVDRFLINSIAKLH